VNEATNTLPVEPTLFSLVEQYADSINSGKVDAERGLPRDASIVVFCQTFFQQFFEHEYSLEITGTDGKSKSSAIRLRLRLEGEHGKGPTTRLIELFQDLCDAWPDILGWTYGGSEEEFEEFHVVYVPRLLKRIEAWAKEHGYDAIADRSRAAAKVYIPASERL
jgi:hypothetical protein